MFVVFTILIGGTLIVLVLVEISGEPDLRKVSAGVEIKPTLINKQH